MFLGHGDSPSVPSVGLSEEQYQLESGRLAVPLSLAIILLCKRAAVVRSPYDSLRATS